MKHISKIIGRTVESMDKLPNEDRNDGKSGRFDAGFVIHFTDGCSLTVRETSQSGQISAEFSR